MAKRIRCRLSRLMGEKRLKISDVVRGTGISRGTVTGLYHEKQGRVDLAVLATLCEFLECDISALLELEDE